jgi:3-oxoacyl-[acyl-carrier protein] reductase
MDLKIRGRTALITGASKGIGFSTAAVLADEGCNLILVARTAAALDVARQSLTKTSKVSVITRALDVSRSSSVDQLVAAHPAVDILVNNAGAIPAGGLSEIDEKRWRDAWELKVFGYVNMTRAFYAAMKKRGGGVIINIIGVAGERLEASYIAALPATQPSWRSPRQSVQHHLPITFVSWASIQVPSLPNGSKLS